MLLLLFKPKTKHLKVINSLEYCLYPPNRLVIVVYLQKVFLNSSCLVWRISGSRNSNCAQISSRSLVIGSPLRINLNSAILDNSSSLLVLLASAFFILMLSSTIRKHFCDCSILLYKSKYCLSDDCIVSTPIKTTLSARKYPHLLTSSITEQVLSFSGLIVRSRATHTTKSKSETALTSSRATLVFPAKTSLSLLYKKHPKKGAFVCILELLKSYCRCGC